MLNWFAMMPSFIWVCACVMNMRKTGWSQGLQDITVQNNYGVSFMQHFFRISENFYWGTCFFNAGGMFLRKNSNLDVALQLAHSYCGRESPPPRTPSWVPPGCRIVKLFFRL